MHKLIWIAYICVVGNVVYDTSSLQLAAYRYMLEF